MIHQSRPARHTSCFVAPISDDLGAIWHGRNLIDATQPNHLDATRGLNTRFRFGVDAAQAVGADEAIPNAAEHQSDSCAAERRGVALFHRYRRADHAGPVRVLRAVILRR